MMLVSTEQPLHAQQVGPTVDDQFAPAAAQHDGDRTVIWMYGEHDISNSDSVAALIAEAISFDKSDVEIDLSGLRFMSCATVHIFVRARENSGCNLVRCPSSHPQRSPAASSIYLG